MEDKFPKRKNIRLKEFDYSTNGAYFVTICTRDKKKILSTISVGDVALGVPQVKLTEIGKIAKKHIEKIEGIKTYVIMPNHIHLIIEKENARTTLSADIKAFKSVITKETGISLWQRSFYDHVIRNMDEYRLIWEYIEGNPDKWTEDKLFIKD